MHDDVHVDHGLLINLARLINECAMEEPCKGWTQLGVRDQYIETKTVVAPGTFGGIHAQLYRSLSQMRPLTEYLKRQYYQSPLDWLIRDYHVELQQKTAGNQTAVESAAMIVALKYPLVHFGRFSTLTEHGQQVQRG